ncbi:tyrosine-protein kinase receptor torso-like isoform X2 [Nymphalis io]|uniref:tyrosine-protein kinase receptor torso-like isoform X2 n=1 Tax=Inachis io TaxID=171585 RepID=UPI002168C1D7|nr:tyrosine-protein kinase receptor torso-like isoform X2 [Nymphalis io]
MGTTYRELFKLYDLIQSGDARSVERFLNENSVDLNLVLPCKGIGVLHLAVGIEPLNKSKECTEIILKHGGDPNLSNDDGITPVHIAAIWGKVDNLKLLLGCGGDPSRCDLDGISAFDYAVREQQWEVYDYLHNVVDQSDDSIGSQCAYTLDLERIRVTTDQMVAEYEPVDEHRLNSATVSRKSEMIRDWCDQNSLVINKLYPTILGETYLLENDSEPGAEDLWEVRPERLLLHEVIGEGAFGVVRRGTFAPSNKDVAVKMLKGFPSVDEIRSFRAEMELMKSVGAHPHVVSLLGCCSGRRPLIVAEYCSRGDLLSYLRCSWEMMISRRNLKYYNNSKEGINNRNYFFKNKSTDAKFVSNRLYDLEGACDSELTYRDLLSFSRQIAMGMEFLASNRVVHRDLAARNVLVTADRTLKIADFGLSRDVYQENQYKQEGNGKMPVKWMALESLTHRIYTTQSDVWSFGVVLWEVVTVGGAPYAGVGAARLPRLLAAGYRMPRPPHCSPDLYNLMLSCWKERPRSRPTFTELHEKLDEMLYACADHYLSLMLPVDLAETHVRPHRYIRMLIR